MHAGGHATRTPTAQLPSTHSHTRSPPKEKHLILRSRISHEPTTRATPPVLRPPSPHAATQ
jgi:hypothetical protein